MQWPEAWKDLRTFYEPDLLLPVEGKDYRIVSPTAREGLRLKAVVLGGTVWSNAEELAELKQLCGSVWQEMLDDGLDWRRIIHIARTALFYYALGPEAGEKYWETGFDDPKNPVPPQPKPRLPGVLARIRARRGTTGIGTPAVVRG